MTGTANMPFGGPGTVHIDYAATFTARMPTDDELARGYPAGAPVLVIDRGGPYGSQAYPHYITVTVEGSHGAPGPDAVRDAAVYVLGVIGRDLDLAHARIDELANAARKSPRRVTDLAGEVRREQAAGLPGPQWPPTHGRPPRLAYHGHLVRFARRCHALIARLYPADFDLLVLFFGLSA